MSAAALAAAFFDRSVLDVAPDLIGCGLKMDGVGGVIVETEAYRADDPACHAYIGRTERNAVLFGPPGLVYVYFSYGVHNMLNAVCEPEGDAAAVLIRALEPRWGIERMRERRRRPALRDLCSGPGKLAAAIGVELSDDGASLVEAPFELTGREPEWRDPEIVAGPRIGISQGIELPWRFCAAESRFLSRPAG